MLNWLIGVQTCPTWTPAEQEYKTLCNLQERPDYRGLLDIDVQGENVLLDVTYGTAGVSLLSGLRPPFRASLAGAVTINARKIDQSGRAWARCAVVAVESPGRCLATALTVGASPAPLGAVYATALDAAVLVVAGIPVALAAGNRLRVIAPVSVVSGAVVWEIEA